MKKIFLKWEEIFNGDLILVNPEHPIHLEDSDRFLSQIGKVSLNNKTASILNHLLQEIDAVKEIVPVSGYRSHLEQKKLYQSSIKENGFDFTKKYVAIPNHSEHQTGLCIDLGINKSNIDFIRPDFPYHGICGLFREKSIEFGFIERYPLGKEKLTKIAHEPWHFRYVGFPHSLIIEKHGFCLEEYIEWLKKYVYNENPLKFTSKNEIIYISYLKAKPHDVTELIIENAKNYLISGNNVDGFIITIWGERL